MVFAPSEHLYVGSQTKCIVSLPWTISMFIFVFVCIESICIVFGSADYFRFAPADWVIIDSRWISRCLFLGCY